MTQRSVILLTDVEQPKHLLTYDLSLSETDAAWHSPLMTFANMRVMKNMRIRSNHGAENDGKRRMSHTCRTDRTTRKSRRKSATEFHLCVEIHSEIRKPDNKAEKDLRAEIPAEIAPLQDNDVLLRDHQHVLQHRTVRRTPQPARRSGYR